MYFGYALVHFAQTVRTLGVLTLIHNCAMEPI